jgi:hypothetical protein
MDMGTYPYLVHVVLEVHGRRVCRPAAVVADWEGDGHMVNAQVFTDADNDALPQVMWVTSVEHSPSGRVQTYHLVTEHADVAAKMQAVGVTVEERLGVNPEPDGD